MQFMLAVGLNDFEVHPGVDKTFQDMYPPGHRGHFAFQDVHVRYSNTGLSE